jgi:hypothetical protein
MFCFSGLLPTYIFGLSFGVCHHTAIQDEFILYGTTPDTTRTYYNRNTVNIIIHAPT